MECIQRDKLVLNRFTNLRVLGNNVEIWLFLYVHRVFCEVCDNGLPQSFDF